MKRIFNIAAALALATCLFSCHKEIMIPDPGFDMSETICDTIRRDTTTTYKIKFNVKAPNGVRYIQLLNGRNFEVIQEFDEYKNKTNFEFSHEFDLSNADPEKDSTFVYNIKIHTNDNRGYNKSIRIHLMHLSHPQITGPSETMNIFGRAFVFDGTIDTGYYTIESINVKLNGQEMMKIGADELNGATNYRLYHNMTYDFEKGREYKYTVTVKDNGGQEKTFEYNLVGAVLKKPVAIKYTSGSTSVAAVLHYNERGLVEAYWEPIGGYICTMQYDENDRCVLNFRTTTSGIGPNSAGSTYGYGSVATWYQYNEDGSIRRFADFGYQSTYNGTVHKLLDPWWVNDHLLPESCAIADVNGTPQEGFVTAINGYNDCSLNVYMEYNGKKYITEMTGKGSSHIGPIVWLDDFEQGDKLCTMFLGTSGQGVHPFYGFDATRWGEIKSFVPVLNPLYIKDFPLFLHLRYGGTMRMQMFACKYVASSCERPYGNASSDEGIYNIPYTVREDGLLKSFGATYATHSNYLNNKPTITYYYDDEDDSAWRPYLNATGEALIEGYLK